MANLPVNFAIDDTNATGILAKTALTNVMTNANGEATLQLQTNALTEAQRYYLQTVGLTVRATSGAISQQLTLKTSEGVAANSASTLLLTPEFDRIKLAVGNKVKITALVLDKNNAVVANAPVSFKLPTNSGLVNNTGAVINSDAAGQAVIEIEIKDLAAATATLQSQTGAVITAQSGATAIGTTTIRDAVSNSNTEAYKFFVTQSNNQMNTTSDTVSMSVLVTDTKGGIKAGVPVYLQNVRSSHRLWPII